MAFVEREHCTGCFSCYSICPKNNIEMLPDNEGFLYPNITDKEKCHNCSLCSECCPLVNIKNNRETYNYPKAYAAINTDENIRNISTSGGIFHLLSEKIIRQNGIVFGAKYGAELSVVHGSETTMQGIANFYGSKYVQSAIGETFRECKENLEEGKVVLFSGTPCQIGGLLAFLNHGYENLFCVDLICMSVPSPKIWESYLNWQKQRHGSSPKKIAFRYKNPGWKQSSMRIDFDNGTVYMEAGGRDLYNKTFYSGIGARYSCYDCRFRKLIRDSDITIADFWGVEKVCPEMDDGKGTSLVIINTIKGDSLFEKIKWQCKTKAVEVGDGIKHNPSAISSKKYNRKRLKKKRIKLFKYINMLSFDVAVKKSLSDPLIIKGAKFIVRRLRKVKRILTG